MRDIKDFSLTELKALAFDLQNDIQVVTREINNRITEAQKPVEETAEDISVEGEVVKK